MMLKANAIERHLNDLPKCYLHNMFGLTFSCVDIFHLLAPIPNNEMLNG